MIVLILAAGKSTRFGSLKQYYEIDDEHHFILDYSLTNAVKAGFKRFIFVIRKEHEQIFLNTLYQRFKDQTDIKYTFQSNELNGTTNALISAKALIDSPFMVINSDDLYNEEIFKQAYNYLSNNHNNANITFDLDKTIYSNKPVKRAIVTVNNHYITNLKETNIIKINNEYYDEENNIIKPNTKVSMNIFCFNPSIYDILLTFINNHKTKQEVNLPDTINELINNNLITLDYLHTDEEIKGITYPEDIKILKIKL